MSALQLCKHMQTNFCYLRNRGENWWKCWNSWVASNHFRVVSAEQLAKQLSQVTETKTWQTSQEMAGQIG
jgi:poly(3-hydroxyalkanoate) synthetase